MDLSPPKAKLKSKIDTSNAKTVYKQNIAYANAAAASKARKSVKLEKKANKFAKGTEENKRLLAESKEAARKSKEFSKMSDIAAMKLRALDEGTIKAGRDFMVQRDVNINLTKIPGWAAALREGENPVLGKLSMPSIAGYNEYRIIEKNPKKKLAKISDSVKKDINDQVARQIAINNAINMQNFRMQQEATRQSINAGLMTASLGMTGGTNPYALGMM